MAKATHSIKEAPKVSIPKENKESYYPKFSLLFGILLIIVVVVDYFNWYIFPDIIINILLLVAGVVIFFTSLFNGMYRRRKGVLKKYI